MAQPHNEDDSQVLPKDQSSLDLTEADFEEMDVSKLTFTPYYGPPGDSCFYTDILYRNEQGQLLDAKGRVRYEADGTVVEIVPRPDKPNELLIDGRRL